MNYTFPNLMDGASAMLAEIATILNRLKVDYIVVGGWSPYLLNSSPISHPGTRDVDILFEKAYNKHSLGPIINELLQQGFILSAKHDFQLFKVYNVQGHEMIYNLDLLHPYETQNPTEIYVEHIDLGIPANDYIGKTLTIKSIALPSSQALFKFKIFDHIDFEATNSSGETTHATIPIMTEVGTLITKSVSVHTPKRLRDGFDIFLAIKQARDYNKLIESILTIREQSRTTYNTLYNIRSAIESRMAVANIHLYSKDAAREAYGILTQFMKDSQLDQKAVIVDEDENDF